MHKLTLMPRSQAQKRWESRHERITVFLSKDLKRSLEAFKGNRTYAELIRSTVEDLARITKEIEDQYKIEVTCVYCKKPIIVAPSGIIHQGLIHNEKFHHDDCSEYLGRLTRW